jgi:hypothetical protein
MTAMQLLTRGSLFHKVVELLVADADKARPLSIPSRLAYSLHVTVAQNWNRSMSDDF